MQTAIDAGDNVRLHAGRVVINPVTAPPSDAAAERLTIELARRRPRLEITELLLEVDAWTQFSSQLTHAAGATPRMSTLAEHLHAALLAAATNLGPTRMAASSDLSYRQVAWATEWYLGDEQLQAANAILVDYLHRLELAAHWGTGRFSSSDGMRSPARARAVDELHLLALLTRVRQERVDAGLITRARLNDARAYKCVLAEIAYLRRLRKRATGDTIVTAMTQLVAGLARLHPAWTIDGDKFADR